MALDPVDIVWMDAPEEHDYAAALGWVHKAWSWLPWPGRVTSKAPAYPGRRTFDPFQPL